MSDTNICPVSQHKLVSFGTVSDYHLSQAQNKAHLSEVVLDPSAHHALFLLLHVHARWLGHS